VGPRTGLDDVEKRKFLTPLGLELRPLGRPVRRQSLYRLRYPGSPLHRLPDPIKIKFKVMPEVVTAVNIKMSIKRNILGHGAV
jgi:hypothetical protein